MTLHLTADALTKRVRRRLARNGGNIRKRGHTFLIQQEAGDQTQHALTLNGLIVLARQMGVLAEFENVEGDHE
jgi:hypothetical protein